MESLATRLGGHRQRAPGEGPFPPGPTNLSIARTQQMANDPLSLLLSNYERYGPIFSMRILYARIVFMIGPAANHYITVSHPHNFHWREGSSAI